MDEYLKFTASNKSLRGSGWWIKKYKYGRFFWLKDFIGGGERATKLVVRQQHKYVACYILGKYAPVDYSGAIEIGGWYSCLEDLFSRF